MQTEHTFDTLQPMPTAAEHLADVEARRVENDELEARIGTLSAQIHALSAELAETVGEFNDGDGWHGWGYRTPAQFLSLRAGWTVADAQRFCRVGAARDTLPTLLGKAKQGKVAVGMLDVASRVVTPDNEKIIAELIDTCTPTQVTRLLATYRRLDDNPSESDREIEPADDVELWWRTWNDEKGRGRLDVALTPQVAELIKQAYAAAKATLERKPPTDADGDETDADDAGAVDGGKLADLVGQRDGGRVNPDEVARLLAQLVLDGVAAGGIRDRARAPFGLLVTVDIETLARVLGMTLDPGRMYSLGSQAFTAGGRHVGDRELAELACHADIQVLIHDDGVPLWMGNEVRHANRHQRRALNHRDQGCQIPGCTTTRYLIPHHVIEHQDDGLTRLTWLLHVCGFHHRLI
ncbi:MAG: DUF222 domain-containing protein, partial [Caldilineaceae bacterium]